MASDGWAALNSTWVTITAEERKVRASTADDTLDPKKIRRVSKRN
jgi:hypothetical protein